MITKCHLSNFGPLSNLNWDNLSNINLIIGENSSGKTFLLKALYSAIRSLEEFQRGDDPRHIDKILSEKLFWTFQSGKLGNLVKKGSKEKLFFQIQIQQKTFSYKFSSSAEKNIVDITNHIGSREHNSIFLPAREIVSLSNVIKKTRNMDKSFGFDDTYLDLVRAIEIEPQKGRNFKGFSNARHILDNLNNGKLSYEDNNWYFKKGNVTIPVNLTSDGFKKISVFERLLSNRYLSDKSVIFIDEPESSLHPTAIHGFIDMLYEISKTGVQIFIATHSYFVIKKLLLIAMRHSVSIPVISLFKDNIKIIVNDLKNSMPENPIIDESIRLYREEVDLAFKIRN